MHGKDVMSAATETFLALNRDGEPIFEQTVKDLGGVWLFPGLDEPIPVSPAPQTEDTQ